MKYYKLLEPRHPDAQTDLANFFLGIKYEQMHHFSLERLCILNVHTPKAHAFQGMKEEAGEASKKKKKDEQSQSYENK
jgi:hypothetical protein